MDTTFVTSELVDPKDYEVKLEHLSREEAATIYFALREYADNLEKTYSNARDRLTHRPEGTEFEDMTFTSEQLHRVYLLLFQMIENHDKATRTEFLKWLDVI